MSETLSGCLDPEAEAEFLATLVPWIKLLAQDATEKQRVVVGHYQAMFKQRLADLEKEARLRAQNLNSSA